MDNVPKYVKQINDLWSKTKPTKWKKYFKKQVVILLLKIQKLKNKVSQVTYLS
jgi:hypothetical protein